MSDELKPLSFAEGLRKLFKTKKWIGKVTEAEHRMFDQAKFAQDQAKKNSFTLGKQRRHDHDE